MDGIIRALCTDETGCTCMRLSKRAKRGIAVFNQICMGPKRWMYRMSETMMTKLLEKYEKELDNEIEETPKKTGRPAEGVGEEH